MTICQLLCVGFFLMAYYHVVLRRFNTLGFRLFSLFFFVGSGVCYGWYTSYRDLKTMQQTGIAAQALVLEKSPTRLRVRFADSAGKSVERIQEGGISVEEVAALKEGHPVSILYDPHSEVYYLTSSLQRQLRHCVYFLVLPGLLFILGIVSWVFLRKYRVQAYNGTIYEYLTDERGNVVLEDTRLSAAAVLRMAGKIEKILQGFQK